MGYRTASGYYWNSKEEQDEAIQKAERLVAKLELWSQRREEVGY